MELRGIYPVLCTPFNSDHSIDYESLDRLVDLQLAEDVHGVVLFGLASEGFKLTETERETMTRHVSRYVNGRVPVVAGAEHAGVVGAATLAARLEASGADAIMSMPPSFVKPGTDDLVAYYKAIDQATSVPIIIQDAPNSTGVVMSAELLVEIAEATQHVRYAKIEAPPPAPKMAKVLDLSGGALQVFGGMGGRAFNQELRVGICGTMIGCAYPDAFVDIWRLAQAGDTEEAEEKFLRLLPILAFGEGLDTFIWGQKRLLSRYGVFGTDVLRRPSTPVDPILKNEWDLLADRFEFALAASRSTQDRAQSPN